MHSPSSRKIDIGTGQPIHSRATDAAAGQMFELECTGQMVGMDMGINGIGQLKT